MRKDAFNKMIVLSYIINDEDKHFNNFGAVRNANRLDFKGPAGNFDSGMCMFCHDKNMVKQIQSNDFFKDPECKPFNKHWEDQLKHVTDFSWIDFNALEQNAEQIVREEYAPLVEMGIRSAEAVKTAVHLMNNRIKYLEGLKESLENKSGFSQTM